MRPSPLHLAPSRIGETDCEELGGGFLAQPLNASTSLAYAVVGLVVLAVSWRQRGRPDAPTVVFAILLTGVGLGSVAFHGPQPIGARFMHDAPILLTVVFILSYDLALLSSRIRRWWVAFAAASTVAVVVSAVDPDVGGALTGVTIVSVAVAEFLVYRRRLRPLAVGAQRRLYAVIIGIVVVAAGSWTLGRTDSPVCDPDGLLQFHGLWHVLSSLVFGAWWWLAIGSQRSRASSSTGIDGRER